MAPLLQTALDEAAALGAGRGWAAPDAATLAEAERLLALLAQDVRQPQVLVEPDGRISFEWDAAPAGWLQLSVSGRGQLQHSAVIEGDEYGQAESFGDTLPDWARTLLGRLRPAGH
ncbi:MAG: hypothetical protein HY855_17150 [Burkholderiales bacterium]|nr:hypothetical protein [Burkholderiales bacterium]